MEQLKTREPVIDTDGLVIENLVKIYKTGKLEVQALRGLTMHVPVGKIAIIMGTSGCGKTTLLNLIGGLDVPTAGLIQFKSRDAGTRTISAMNPKELELFRRNHVGYVFQFMNLVPILTAAENIALPMRIAGASSSRIKTRVQELIDLVQLTKREHHRPDEMSGGEQQRVAIAAALANDPQILLCDEPTGELDTSNKQVLMNLFRDIIEHQPGKIILIVTHDPELQKIADLVFHIRDGVIIDKLEGTDLAAHVSTTPTDGTKTEKQALQLREMKKMLDELAKRIGDLEKGF